MEDQEKRISYMAGITRSPSDFLCKDGELAECIGLTSDGEELKVVPPLTVKRTAAQTAGRRLVFVHKLGNGTENYIYEGTYSSSLYLYKDGTRIAYTGHNALTAITAVGNTLVVSFDGALGYLLYKNGAYTYVDDIPKPQFDCYIGGETEQVNSFLYGDVVEGVPSETIYEGKQQEYNDAIVGLYSKNKKAIHKKGRFVNPFFVRAALEMYDGSYQYITNPVLMFPCFTMNTFAQIHNIGDIGTLHSDWMEVHTFGRALCCGQDTDYSDYGDLVKGVAVFVSDEIDVYDTSDDCPIHNITTQTPLVNAIYATNGFSAYHEVSHAGNPDTAGGSYYCKVLTEREAAGIAKSLGDTPVFYKVATLGVEPTQTTDISSLIGDHVLDNLEAQERLLYDDFYSRSRLLADYLSSYNNRLNMSKVRRHFFQGFHFFMPLEATEHEGTAPTYDFWVTVNSQEAGQVTVHCSKQTWTLQGIWFFYPDPRATHVVIRKTSGGVATCVCNQKLTEHPSLNGAYFFRGMVHAETVDTAPSSWPTASPTQEESLGNYVLQSEVNNPFVFHASGYVRVGNGLVFGMAAQTKALSQGQFGHYPMLAFTTEGIWALGVDETGAFSRADPMSREVAWQTNPCITPVDGAVFFVSKKGLMVVEGGSVRCVSEQMNGKAFKTTGTPVDGRGLSGYSIGSLSQDIETCSDSTLFRDFLLSAHLRIAYDYVDNRLLLLNGSKGYSWVYSLKAGGFSKMSEGTLYDVVNAYPDYLVQELSGTPAVPGAVYTLYEKTREETVGTRYSGFLLTRPMQLGGALTVASLRELKNVGCWEEGANDSKSWVKTMVLVSDDLVNWYERASRFGAGAKYFRIALFVHMLPVERLSGTILRVRAVRDRI